MKKILSLLFIGCIFISGTPNMSTNNNIQQMFEENNLNPDFAAGELLKAWEKE